MFKGKAGRLHEIVVASGEQVKKGDLLVQLIADDLEIQLKEQELALEKAKYAFQLARDGDEKAFRIAGLQAQLEQLKYDRLAKQYQSQQLYAEIDGQVVFTESMEEGDYVEAFQPLVMIADPKKLRISLRVDNPNDIREVQVGLPAEIVLKGKKFIGTVTQTPSSSPVTSNQQLADKYAKTLYLDLPELPEEAKIGSIVNVNIVTQQRDNVVKIPRSALRTYLGRNFVRVLEDDQRLREIDVEPGLTGSTEVEIVKGLEEGQVVVLP